MTTVAIELPHSRYDVWIEAGALDRFGEAVQAIAPHDRCVVVGDERVVELHADRVVESLQAAGYDVATSPMPTGEPAKNLETVQRLYRVFLDHRLERRSPVIALGGGVTGDTVGFAAATYLRGVPLIQCPTSLLAMVDASVGGKVGVNLPEGKNLLGAFYQPAGVGIDPLVLGTLPRRELRCGLAECVKHGMIRDADLFAWTEQTLDRIAALDADALEELLSRNVRIKADVVAADEKESAGIRAHLNFGHTFAHAIEATTAYNEFHHGEAVSLGMVAATALAVDRGLCEASVLERLRALLDAAGLPTRAKLPETERLVDVMHRDKKVQDDRIRLILPEAVGKVAGVEETRLDRLERAWDAVRHGGRETPRG